MSDPALTREPPVPLAFHPSVFVLEEMEARGWDRDRLAWHMVLGTGNLKRALAALVDGDADQMHDWQVTRLALDFFFDLGPTEPNMRMGDDMARGFARAFGTSDALFTNLETAWLQSLTPTEIAHD